MTAHDYVDLHDDAEIDVHELEDALGVLMALRLHFDGIEPGRVSAEWWDKTMDFIADAGRVLDDY